MPFSSARSGDNNFASPFGVAVGIFNDRRDTSHLESGSFVTLLRRQ